MRPKMSVDIARTSYLKTKIDLTQEEVVKLFKYNPDTGQLFWKRPRHKRHLHEQAGCAHNKGYRQVIIHGRGYLTHRIAWLMVYGTHPKEIDHINGVRDDNRLSNLRAVSRVGNQHNARTRKDNTSGTPGVTFDRRHNRWVARMQVRGRRMSLGRFLTYEEAADARLSAKRSLEESEETSAWRTSEVITTGAS